MQPTLETNEKTAVLPIACYPWGGTYRPAAWAQCGLDGESLHLLLWCQEDNRDKPRYLHDNEPVYTDSCLEAFLACYPQRSEEYVNFEVNRAGAMLMQRGTGRADRVFLTASAFPGVPFPKAEAFEHETGWGVRICVPLRFLQTLYGADSLPDLAAGHPFRPPRRTSTARSSSVPSGKNETGRRTCRADCPGYEQVKQPEEQRALRPFSCKCKSMWSVIACPLPCGAFFCDTGLLGPPAIGAAGRIRRPAGREEPATPLLGRQRLLRRIPAVPRPSAPREV